MPDFPDDPTSSLPGESGESASQTITPTKHISAGNDTQSAEGVAGSPAPLRRRRRRRPRKPQLDQVTPDARPQAGESAASDEDPASADAAAPPLHRRRRRRRRGPRPDAASLATPADQEHQAAGGASELPATAAKPGDLISPEPVGDAVQRPAAQSGEGKPEGPARARRRRRRGPRPFEPVADAAVAGEAVPAVPGETGPGERRDRVPRTGARSRVDRGTVADGDRGPQIRGPRQRRGPGEGQPNRRPRDTDLRNQAPSGYRPRSGGGARFEGRDRDARERSRGRAQSGRADRRRGRGRDEPKKEPERRLYALESVVDRGFEDVTDEGGDNETRRVHWTVIKRMVADQNSGKAISTVYVLQRDGVESEFPSLGTARAAANKTIVHPEKLTMSKAEHAAAKGDGDGTERNRRQR
jgi:hypothetical protein